MIKDFTKEAPKNKKELTKENMLAYIKKAGKKADKEWFFNLMNDNKEKKVNNLTGKQIEGYNMPVVREAFAQKYFPNIASKNKKKPTAKTLSFEDELYLLLAD